MIVGSIKENTSLEKRVSLTPESAKNIIGLGLKVCVEKGYALHLGIDDNEYSGMGVEIKSSSKEVLNFSDFNELAIFIIFKAWQCPTLPYLKTKYHRR